MKKLFLLLSVSMLASCGGNKAEQNNDGKLSTDLVTNPASAEGADPKILSEMPTMDFTDTVHDFGRMTEGEVVTYDFEFKNNGKKPLIISSATGSCGCTAPDYPHDPIEPGKSGVIHVKFNSEGKQHHQEKTVTVATNTTRGSHILHIKADVTPNKSKNPNEISTSLSDH